MINSHSEQLGVHQNSMNLHFYKFSINSFFDQVNRIVFRTLKRNWSTL